MKAQIINTLLAILLSFSLIALYSCSEESDTPGLTTVRISMVDAPGDFDSVIIDLEDIFINLSGSSSDWQSISEVNSGSFDVLKLINGNERILGETSIAAGNFSEVRLLLGTGNRYFIGDSAVFLPLPSENRAGLKIEINEYLEAGNAYNLLLDFDVDKSIIKNNGSNEYTLKPVIRGNFENKSGAIKGKINPSGSRYRIMVVRASDTIRTISNSNGEFLIRALNPGIYDLSVPSESGIGLNVSEIAIRAGEVKDLGDLRVL